MIRAAVLVLLLAGCQLAKEERTPRGYDCIATCEGCEKCEVECSYQGEGRSDKRIGIEAAK